MFCLSCLKTNDRLSRCLDASPICSKCLTRRNARALLVLMRNAGWTLKQLLRDMDEHYKAPE